LGGFSIGEHHVDPLTGTVQGPGGSIHLHPKAVEILLRLADNPGELVSREELIASVWDDAEADHAALSGAISELRHALGDHADHPKYIQTLPKRGYVLLVEPRFASAQSTARLAAPTRRAHGEGLISELNRRGVTETAIAYFVIGWLLIQIADVTFDQLGLPQRAVTFVTYFVIAGFPLALLFAWFMEITPGGPVLDRDPAARSARKPFGTKYVAILSGLVMASAGVFVYDRFVGLPPGRGGEPAGLSADAALTVELDSIAVLPFLNIDGTEEMRIFGDGLAEDVISRLAAIPPLRVSSRGDSFALAPNSASRDVRSRLRVAYYVEGSVRRTGEMLRVVAQLIDSANGFHIESRTFDRAIGEFSEIQNEITNLIVASLRVALPSLAETPGRVTAETASFDAYLEYRRGMDILYRPMTRQAIDQALAAFRESLAVDPDYAAAFAGICLTYTAAYDVTRETGFIDQAERSCGSALDRSPNLIVVHDALGELYLRTGRYAQAESAFERALAINANDVPALTGLADAYLSQQRLAEAERRYRQAVGLQPGNWRTYNSLGGFLFTNGRFGEAADAYREVVAVDTRNATGWGNLATSLMLSGNFAEAIRAFERAMEMEPSPRTLMNLGMLHYYLGDAEQAKAALETAIDMAPQDYLAWSNLGDVLTVYGEPEAANRAFTEAERLAREQLAVNSRDPGRIIDLAWITAMLGQLDEAERLITTALELAPVDPYVHFYDALVHVRMGETEAALDRLQRAVELGYSRAMIGAEPHLAELRSHERFVELVGD
jgi:tetratricopeptide (TPR) repeat protein/DNA-binding winged helix-turn-helix (wHTH) protein